MFFESQNYVFTLIGQNGFYMKNIRIKKLVFVCLLLNFPEQENNKNR